jgi:hypothetical protein
MQKQIMSIMQKEKTKALPIINYSIPDDIEYHQPAREIQQEFL